MEFRVHELRLTLVVACFFVCLRSAELLAQNDYRTWSDSTGTFSVQAKLLRIDESTVQLLKSNGKEISVPFTALSKLDSKYIDSQKSLATDLKVEDLGSSTPNLGDSILKAPILVKQKVKKVATTLDLSANTVKPAILVSNPSNLTLPENNEFGFDIPLPSAEKTDSNLGLKKISIPEEQLTSLPQSVRDSVEEIINSPTPDARLKALVSLSKNWPSQQLPAVIEIVAQCTKSESSVTRRVAVSILGKKAPTLGLPAILDCMSDVDRNIRMDAYKLVGEIGDQRAIDLLVDRISTSDREQVMNVLAKFGSIVQPKVLPLLSHQNESVRQHVCRLIGRIGTPEAIEPLKQLAANETSLRVRLQASAAIQSIMDNRSTDNQ